MPIRRVLVFFPFNPYPPRSGAHRRLLQIVAALRAAGCTVTLASSTSSRQAHWNASSVHELVPGYVDGIYVHQESAADQRFVRVLRRFYHLTRRRPGLSGWLATPPGMRRWFMELAD